MDLSVCGAEKTCLQVLPDYKSQLSEKGRAAGCRQRDRNPGPPGPTGWNVAQGDDLTGIPVTLIGGDHFTRADAPERVARRRHRFRVERAGERH